MTADGQNLNKIVATVHGEFLQNLKVANFFIDLKDNVENFKISKISFKKHIIDVNLTKSDNKLNKGNDAFVIPLPSNIFLYPRSINSLKVTTHDCSFRATFDYLNKDKANVVEVTHQNFIPKCFYCDNNLLIGLFEFSNGLVEVAQLKSSTYFCHNHSHNSCENQTVRIPVQAIVKGSNIFLHKSVIDAEKIYFNNNSIHCIRCHHVLGITEANESDDFKMYTNCINTSISSGTLVQRLSSSNKLQLCSKENATTLILWIMDSKLTVVTGHLDRCTTSNINHKKVCKVMFKINDEVPKVNGLECLEVNASLLFRLCSELVKSNEELPPAWRAANKLKVGYLNC